MKPHLLQFPEHLPDLQISKQQNSRFIFFTTKIKLKQKFIEQNILEPLPKPINSDISELLKRLLQIKTENSQCRNNEIIKTQILRFKKENQSRVLLTI